MYQRTMDEMLEGIENAHAVMDDILVAGTDQAHHDAVLREVIERAVSYNLKLNFDKVKIRKSRVPYVGHVITENGLMPDPEKIRAVRNMPAPDSKEGVRRFLGFIRYLAKFLPKLAEEEEPLRELTKDKLMFHWDKPQEAAFIRLKEQCCQAPVLAYYDVKKEVTIQCDASKSAVGTVLLQEGKPVAFASRKLRKSELNWAPIEKEMLAILVSTEKFHEYILGKETKVQTDHKPLVNICQKPLVTAPLRLQAMLLKMKGYDLKVEYLPGKEQYLADTLSRASLDEVPPDNDDDLEVNMLDRISVAPAKYVKFQQATANELHELYRMTQLGWPDTKQQVPHSIREYWDARAEIACMDGIVYRGMGIVVPPSLRAEMLTIIHRSHQGMVKTKQRAREALYWPGMGAQIEEKIADCPTCRNYAPSQAKEPLLTTPVPELPWEVVASDIFHLEGQNYILSIDYYSKYICVTKLANLSSGETIEALKNHFAEHGIPQKLMTDCGTQYTSGEFEEFAKDYGFVNVTSSPKHSKANGEAEAAVKIVKSAWLKTKDKQLALLDFRTTSLPDIDLSPAQLLNSRRSRSRMPIARGLLEPAVYNAVDVNRRMRQLKTKQKHYHDRNSTKELPPLLPGEHVRVRPEQGSKVWTPAVVKQHHNAPRSYIVDTGRRQLRRNRLPSEDPLKLPTNPLRSRPSQTLHGAKLPPE